ncbi:MAG: DUF333 domain-containing protein [Caldilineaceae bacterium]|nr:DUF333 domain-containing protein [Caldilineaceae bacterium]
MLQKMLRWIYFLCSGILLAACVTNIPGETVPAPTTAPTANTQIANPASENCVQQGGALTLETDGSGAQYGVCVFEDNRQCEEWALLRGDCPVGGLRVTGYNTPAARYCAITGGAYAVDENATTSAEAEQGACTLADGQSYDVWAYYNGAGAQASANAPQDPFAYCAEVGTIDEPVGDFGATSNPGVPEALVAGLKKASGISADAPSEMLAQNSYWRCMDGRVYACFVGANLPCTTKADTSITPTAAMNSFCTSQPNADVIPAAVTGRATVYSWSCADGVANAGEQVFDVDAQGFLANIWYAIDPVADNN